MISAKIKLYKSKTLASGEHPIVIQIHSRKTVRFYLKKSSRVDHWNFQTEEPNKKHPNYKSLQIYVRKSKIKLDEILIDMELESIPFTKEEFTRRFFGNRAILFVDYAAEISKSIRTQKNGNHRTAEWYDYAADKLEEFKTDVYLNELNFELIEQFKNHLSQTRNPGGVSYILRGIRAIVNKAIKSRKVKYQEHPFSAVSIPSSKKQDKSLSKEEIVKLINKELPDSYNSVRDIWLAMFFMRGMEFVDIAYLEWNHIGRNEINYERSKNDRLYSIGINKVIQDILNKQNRQNRFVFSLLSDNNNYNSEEGQKEFKAIKRSINKKLNKIGKMLDFEVSLNTKLAKHTFAHVMDELVDEKILQGLLGHEDSKSTDRYRGKAKNKEMDQSVERLLSELSITVD